MAVFSFHFPIHQYLNIEWKLNHLIRKFLMNYSNPHLLWDIFSLSVNFMISSVGVSFIRKSTIIIPFKWISQK